MAFACGHAMHRHATEYWRQVREWRERYENSPPTLDARRLQEKTTRCGGKEINIAVFFERHAKEFGRGIAIEALNDIVEVYFANEESGTPRMVCTLDIATELMSAGAITTLPPIGETPVDSESYRLLITSRGSDIIAVLANDRRANERRYGNEPPRPLSVVEKLFEERQREREKAALKAELKSEVAAAQLPKPRCAYATRILPQMGEGNAKERRLGFSLTIVNASDVPVRLVARYVGLRYGQYDVPQVDIIGLESVGEVPFLGEANIRVLMRLVGSVGAKIAADFEAGQLEPVNLEGLHLAIINGDREMRVAGIPEALDIKKGDPWSIGYIRYIRGVGAAVASAFGTLTAKT